MKNQILINSTFNETRVALIEKNNLVEIYVERGLSPQMVGNIYKGRIEKIVPGMQAAFVDIGAGKSGFMSGFSSLPAWTAHRVGIFSRRVGSPL